MKRFLYIIIMLIVFATYFACPILAGNGSEGPGSSIGGGNPYSELNIFSNSNYPDMGEEKDVFWGGIDAPI